MRDEPFPTAYSVPSGANAIVPQAVGATGSRAHVFPPSVEVRMPPTLRLENVTASSLALSGLTATAPTLNSRIPFDEAAKLAPPSELFSTPNAVTPARRLPPGAYW